MSTTLMTCINDTAYEKAAADQAKAIKDEAFNWAATQVAIMVAQKLIDDEITGMQEDIANRRYQLAKNILDHAKVFWPKEKEFVDTAMAESVHSADYTWAQEITTEVDTREDEAVANAHRALACQGIDFSSCDESRMHRAMAQGRTDLVSHAMRSAEARAYALNDRRYSRQYSAVGLGRGVLREAIAIGSLGADGKGALSKAIWGTINSGIMLWGYPTTRWQRSGGYDTQPSQPAPTWRAPRMDIIQPEVPKQEVAITVTPQLSTPNSWTDANDWGPRDLLQPK